MASKLSLFLDELKRRKVGRVAVVYAVVGVGVIEAADLLFDAFDLPHAAYQVVTFLVVLGFPLALVLSWALDLTPEGIQRAPDPGREHRVAHTPMRWRPREWVKAVAGLVVVVAAGYLAVSRRGAPSTLGPEEEAGIQAEAPGASPESDGLPAIAVLPCENFSPDPEDAYFASGIHEEILLSLSKLSGLRSMGRETVEWYRDHPRPIREMALELAVGFVGQCSVRMDVERNLMRLTFQLIDAETGRQLWAESYDEELTANAFFEIQSDVARQLVQAVGAILTTHDQALLRARPTRNTEAFRLYLRGRFFWNRSTEEGFRSAIEYFQQALERDPSYALAWAGIADSYNSLGWHDVLPSDEVYPMARAAAERALAIDEGLAEAYAALGRVHQLYDWDWPAAERAFLRALELNPSYAEAHQWYAEYLAYMGRHRESIEQATLAKALDPLSLGIRHHLALMYFNARQYDRSIAEYQALMELDPDFAIAHNFLGLAYAGKGMYDAALAELERGIELSGGEDPLYIGTLGFIYASMGRREEAEEVLERLVAISRTRYVAPVNLAMICGVLGRKDEAFEWMQRAYEVRDDFMMSLKIAVRLDSLRSDPRFEEWLRRMGFSS